MNSREAWRVLNELEDSRWKALAQPKVQASLLGGVALVVLLSLYFTFRLQTPGPMIAALPMIGYLGIAVLAYVTSLTVITSYQTDWWLSYPVSRRVLVLAKWWSTMRHGLLWLAAVALLSALVYVLTWAYQPSWYPTASVLMEYFGGLSCVVLAVPATAAMGTASLAFMTGKMRILQPVLYVFSYGAIGGIEGYLQANSKGLHGFPWAIGLPIIAVASILLTIVFLYLTFRRVNLLAGVVGRDAWKGSSWWRDRTISSTTRSLPAPSDASDARGDGAVPSLFWVHWLETVRGHRLPPWMALLTMEASRFRFLGQGADIRLQVLGACLFPAGLMGGLFVHTQLPVLYVPGAVLLFTGWMVLCIGFGVSQQNRHDYLKWYLGFPCSRVAIILGSALAWLIRMSSLLILVEAGLGIGMVVRGVIHPLPFSVYEASWVALLKCVCLVLTLVPCYFLILQTAAYALQGPWMVLMIPIFASIGFAGPEIARIYIPTIFANPHTLHITSGFWPLLWIGLAIGLLSAGWFTRAGARNLHQAIIRRSRWTGNSL